MKTHEMSALEFDCINFARGLDPETAVTPGLISEFLTEYLFGDNVAHIAKKYITASINLRKYITTSINL